MSQQPRVSVVVPTRNRPDVLEACLRSVLSLDYGNFEVVLIDQSTNDASEKIATGLADPRLTYLRTSTVGKSRGANIGVAQATGSIIAFTDDDCTVPSVWLSRITEVLANEPSAGVYCGAVTAPVHDESESFIPTYSPRAYQVSRGKVVRSVANVMGANMAIRREVFDRIGGYNVLMGPGSTFRSGEDWELTYRAVRAGFGVVEDPNVQVMHWGARTVADGQASRLLMDYYFGHGAGYILNARKGDPAALWALCKEVIFWLKEVVSNFVHGRHPVGARRLLYVLYGASAAAFSRPEPPPARSLT